MVGTLLWMAPEVIDPSETGGYDFKADVWSLGITCIELAYGSAPYADSRPTQAMRNILSNKPPSLDDPNPTSPTTITPKKFSSTFKEFVIRCLKQDPKQRAEAGHLLNHNFFKDLAPKEQMKEILTDGIPPQAERFKIEEETKKESRAKILAASGIKDRIASNRNLSSPGGSSSSSGTGIGKEGGEGM
eukprot:TRINITY_DN2305_c0_g2_i1.p1 TRINITY_DN2305_c0_g2~~TRINITY_DN2305_c0_g2_i1.p1  ORF type:complete len:208 (-),score=43.15 TRINITY_DN2305_c0_g2_i1:33-596(-)